MSAEGAMIALTAVSVIVAAVAAWVAAKARGLAQESVYEAQKANVVAAEANRLSGDANRIAEESVGIAKAADELARAAPTESAWDALLVAVAAVQTYDPTDHSDDAEKARPLLTEIRTRGTLLVDRLEWEAFDPWIAAEMQFGALLMSEASMRGDASSAPLGVEDRLKINDTYYAWVAGFMSNLRRFRKVGQDAAALAELTQIAKEAATTVAARVGLPPPPDKIPRLKPLKPE